MYSQNTLYVDANATGINTGESWDDAFKDLQLGIDASEAGDTILMTEGIYTPSIEFTYELPFGTGPKYQTFMSPDSVKVFGGFDAETGIRDLQTNPTIISGKIDSVHCLNTMIFMECSDETLLDGVIVENGKANQTGVSHHFGNIIFHDCGSLVYFSNSNITLRNVWLRHGFAQMVG